MIAFSKRNVVIYIFLVLLVVLLAVALYGWLTGAWYETPP
jgi:hypothetical protein